MRRIGLAIVLITSIGCSRDSSTVKADSAAAADSARGASGSAPESAAVAGPSAVDSVRPPLGSTEGTIGETRKTRGRAHVDSSIGRDSAIQGPYHTMDSLGHIKR